MKIDLKKYHIYSCNYCDNHGAGNRKCDNCIGYNKYISVLSEFECSKHPNMKLYFELLEDYTKMLYNMGFDITVSDDCGLQGKN